MSVQMKGQYAKYLFCNLRLYLIFFNALGLARRVNARILIASTSEVDGDPEIHPQSESYWGHVNPIGDLFTALIYGY